MQLVELHESIGDETAVVAISYDPVETLTGFAANHGITFPLLSDVGSETMASLGVLNTEIEDEVRFWGREPEQKHRGLPFPGVFLLDAAGIVTAKHFERSHRNRASAATLLSMLGAPSPSHDITVEGSGPSLAVRVNIHRAAYFPNQVFPIEVEMAVEQGFHLYLPPVPDGYRALSVSVDGPEGIFTEPPALPEGEPFEMLGDTFNVAGGTIRTVVPIHIHENVGDVELTVVVSYQACDDSTCLVPTEVRVPIGLTSRGKL
ncbi:MAG: redoxin domain-containing protein [Acidimicrobiia bacterium]